VFLVLLGVPATFLTGTGASSLGGPKEEREQLEQQAAELNQEANRLYLKGQYQAALNKFEQALSIEEKLYPKDKYPLGHANLATALNNVGFLFKVQGDYQKALLYLQRALDIRQALYDKDKQGHPELAINLDNLGTLFHVQGDFQKALTCHQRAAQVFEELYPKAKYPKGHPSLAISLDNVGSVLRSQGEYQRALAYHLRAQKMFEALYLEEKDARGLLALSTSLNNLGFLFHSQQQYQQALPYLQRALQIKEQLYPKARYPKGHPDLARSLANLGTLLLSQQKFPKGSFYLEQALQMDEELYPEDKYPRGHPYLAHTLNRLGSALSAQGTYPKALPHLQRALKMRRELYPKAGYPHGHPELAESLRSLSLLLLRQEKYKEALTHLEPALCMDQQLANDFAALASEAQALNFAASMPLTRDALLSMSLHPAAPDIDVYPHVWRSKSAITRILQRRQQALLRTADSETVKLWEKLLRTRRELAQLVLAPARTDKDLLKYLQELTDRKEQLERQLAKVLPPFTRQKELEHLGPGDLAKQLPPHTAFVDLVQYIYLELNPKKPGRIGEKQTRSYTAFVLNPGQSAKRVELGPARPIEEAVTQWRKDIAANKSGEAAQTLRKLVWEPIAKRLAADTQTVFLVPDADLTRIPWAGLPGKKKGTVLLEEYALAIVPHGLFLLDQLTTKPAKDEEPGMLLAVGDVSYDHKPKPLTRDAAAGDRSPEVGDKVVSWPKLPGTLKELAQVISLAGKRPILRRTGIEASTAQLIADLSDAKKAPRFVHLATHGFFADPSFRSVLQVNEELFQYRGFQDRARPGDRNPLVLSGIVLAGANLPPPKDLKALLHDDRGILTAETIAGLPLRQLELVVLSACETGLGEVAGREGVYGLQRAFHLAGAKNVVASLWKVDDEATAALMGLFYHKLWQEKQPPLQALRQAQLFLYRHPELVGKLSAARGPKDLSKIVTLPPDPKQPPGAGKAPVKLWAGFVLSGAGQ
jgi:CHAT domain-containing protein/Tfp pilus assembly protein PilF